MDARPAEFSTNVFRAQPSEGLQRKIQKRNRPPVSCLLCRTRKVKCDRQQPCERCSKSGEARFCEYAPRAPRKPRAAEARPQLQDGNGRPKHQEPVSKPVLQVRLQKLEDIVQGFMAGPQAQASLLTPSSSDQYPESDSRSDLNSPPGPSTGGMPQPGSLMPNPKMPDNTYAGATHWASILESIQDIRGIVANEAEGFRSPSPANQQQYETTDIVFGRLADITHEQAVARVPPRECTDRHVLAYFRSRFNTTKIPYIHSTKFQREYDAFWHDPSSASFCWLSCLASILAISSARDIARGAQCDISDLDHPENLRALSSACLVAGDYLSCRPYSIEALMLNGYAEVHQNTELGSGLWARFGLLTRLAQRMGYHRDPAYLKHISPFEGEMRRRVWICIEVFDVIYSFQLGVPPIIREDECDTQPPSNLYDTDFDEDCAMLPAARPLNDLASTLYLKYKSRLCKYLRCVIRYGISHNWPAYEDILKLDSEINECHHQLPNPLKIRPIRSYSFTDENSDIMNRLMLELMYLKTICVLHRPFLTKEKDNPRYELSRKASREAAQRILQLHVEYEEECKKGGRLYEDKFVIATLTLHDFLIASMIMCLDLLETTSVDQAERTRKIELLGDSYRMWADRRHISKDAAHGARVVGAILRKVSLQGTPQPPVQPKPDVRGGSLASLLNNDSQPPAPSPAPMPMMDPSCLVPAMDGSMDLGVGFPLESVLSNADIDWNTIDQYILNPPDDTY